MGSVYAAACTYICRRLSCRGPGPADTTVDRSAAFHGTLPSATIPPMPRHKNDTDVLLADLVARLEKLVVTARREGRESALNEVRSVVGGGSGTGTGSGSEKSASKLAKPKKKSSKPRKNPWASMTPEQKADRVRKMLAGRGLKPKAERKPVAKSAARKTAKKATVAKPKRKSSKPRKNPWANLTPEERLKRVNAIRKGRGLPLKRKL